MSKAGIAQRRQRASGAAADRPSAPRPLGPLAPAFTMIELLVVITIVGILIAAIALVASKVLYKQKVVYTQSIMRNVSMGIEQFANEDPLRGIYDQKDAATFGPYPPYMLDYHWISPSVSQTLEPPGVWPVPNTQASYFLAQRIGRDLGQNGTAPGPWTNLPTSPTDWKGSDGWYADRDGSIRALYTYLKVFSPGVLAQIPPDRVRAPWWQNPATPMYVDPSGQLVANPQNQTKVDVLEILDAWGVPLNYYMYAKLEVRPDPTGATPAMWVVTDRVPVLWSWGVSLDVHKVQEQQHQQGLPNDAIYDQNAWIFSEPFPLPAMPARLPPPAPSPPNAVVDAVTGQLLATPVDGTGNGWVRVKAPGDPYAYGE